MYVQDPLNTLFNDSYDREAARNLSWQPATYIESVRITYCAWKDIPCDYLCCTKDQITPLEAQEKIAAAVGAKRVEKCDAGHMVCLSQPERVVEFVRKAAEDL